VVALRTERGRLRPAWSLAYALALRGYASYLTLRAGDLSVYVAGSTGSGQPAFGLSDIDLAIVLTCDDGARSRILRRWERLERAVPVLPGRFLDRPLVIDADVLLEAASASALTLGLEESRTRRDGGALYLGPAPNRDRISFLQKPGMYGPGADWRLLRGPDLRPPRSATDAQAARVAAWLELQFYWRWLLQECVHPDPMRVADLCVKLVAEPIRILLWLIHGERRSGRPDVLERGTEVIPEEEPAIRAALELQRRLPLSSPTLLDDFLPALVRLSALVGSRLAHEMAAQGSTRVPLAWEEEAELIISPRARSRLERLSGSLWDGRLIPLADWRALACPEAPDETLAPLTQAPAEPSRLAQAAEVGNSGAYPGLLADGLLVLASHRYPRSSLRAVQCPVTDPVSFALLAGKSAASFPDVRGWSARDWARRAATEHRAWLESVRGSAGWPDEALSRLFTAARAGLFLESVLEGAPELPLTVAATAERLERVPRAGSVAQDAAASHREHVTQGATPPSATVEAMAQLVLGLPAYSR
jgi:hypothetical protein